MMTNNIMGDKRVLGLCLVVAVLIINLAYHSINCPQSATQTAQQPIQYECAHQLPADYNTGDRDRILTELSGPNIQHDDPRLVRAIAKYMIDKPRPFVSKFSVTLYETPQAKAAMAILKKKGGFFVECGGLDGERSSNTIFMENKHQWSGLLVEMDPSWYMQLRGKNRKSYSINSCLSPNPYPSVMEFKEHSMGQGKLMSGNGNGGDTIIKTFCFPLYSIMLALNRTKIDFFSLDVEGMELPILKTIPFDKLDISVLAVEYIHGKDGGQAYIDFMATKGYVVHSKIQFFKPEIYFGANDFIFVKKDL